MDAGSNPNGVILSHEKHCEKPKAKTNWEKESLCGFSEEETEHCWWVDERKKMGAWVLQKEVWYLNTLLMADVHDKKTRSYNMRSIRSKDTKPELLVWSFLHREDFRFRLHDKKLPGKPDIVLKKYKMVLLA